MLTVTLTRSTQIFSLINLLADCSHSLSCLDWSTPTPPPTPPHPSLRLSAQISSASALQRACKLGGVGPRGMLFEEEGASHTMPVEDFTMKSVFLASLEILKLHSSP